MNPIETLYTEVNALPGVQAYRTENSLTALPDGRDGFDVAIVCRPNERFTVSYRGWLRHFDDPKEAADCFRRGLTDRVRLKVTRRGLFEYKWVLERRGSSGWTEIGRNALKLAPYWKGAKTFYLKNNLLSGGGRQR